MAQIDQLVLTLSELIEICEDGEKIYRTALKRDLPGELRGLVEEQFRKIKELHEHLKTMETEAKDLEEFEDIGGATEGAPD